MAPEVLGMSYAHKCDIWSVGVIAFLVLSGQQPFKGQTDQDTFNNIVNGAYSFNDPIWDNISDRAKDFVKTLLIWDQNERPSAAEALEHTWIEQKARRMTTAALRESTKGALTNLEAFEAQSKLRVATCTFIASQLMDKAEKERIDDVFRAMDLNNDGTLDRSEVKYGYEHFFDRKLSDEEIDAIFTHVDADGTGELEYSEFLFGAMDKQNLLDSENLKKAFSMFDKVCVNLVLCLVITLLCTYDRKRLKQCLCFVSFVI
jgi:calcium-dependent protein kinase